MNHKAWRKTGQLFQKELAEASSFPYDPEMISFEPNIENRGRIVRAIIAFALFDMALAAALLLNWPFWVYAPLFLISFFTGFEAFRGWCIARACGIKTPL